MVSLNLFLTPDDRCSYLPEQRSRSLFVDPQAPLNPSLYGQLMAAGYRRSGSHVYSPRCDSCSACIPIRLPAGQFRPSRSQQRNRRLNQDLSLHQVSQITEEHVQLYEKYMQVRHPDSPMAPYGLEECRRFMQAEWCETLLLEFRLQRQLLAVAVTDCVPGGLSAVYTYFDPEQSRRALGVYGVLSQLELARQLGLQWLYLGFWIADCQKMRYKTNYLPLELRIEDKWQLFNAKP